MENKNGKQDYGKRPKDIIFCGKQRIGKQKWKTNNTTYLQVK
ncbi:MAG: hypothetical protein U9O56_04705 [Campylobacterota bacterium]|nr:hypothetical protein [Campylobacterota bacterium]